MSSLKFPYQQPRFENDLVVLEPFNPDIHIKRIVEETQADPTFLKYSGFPNVDNEDEWRTGLWDTYFTPANGGGCYAVFDKRVDPGADKLRNYAGLVALANSEPSKGFMELGVLLFPAFHRTNVSANAIGLTLLWLLDPPSAGGLGLRRVEWQTGGSNDASRNFALRMGFELEGILRWKETYDSPGKIGVPVDALEKRNGTTGELPGKHIVVFSIVWEEWDDKRPNVIAQMERKA